MDGYTNGYAMPRQDARNMPLSTAANGMPISAAMLTDPKELKKWANGTTNSHLNAPSSSARHNSEPPSSFPLVTSPTISPSLSRDDAHHVFGEQGRNKKTTNASVATKSPPARFDPRQLLDPKGFNQNRSDSRSELNDFASPRNSCAASHQQNMLAPHPNGTDKRNHEEVEGHGQGNLIERMHNVTNYEERLVKKRKTEDNDFVGGDERGKAAFGGGKGDLGEYLKEKRKEGQENSVATNAVVDLTGGDDEDIVLVSDSADMEVCYGRLDHAKVQAHLVPNPSPKSTLLGRNDWPAMKIKLHRFPGKDNIIRVLDPTGKDFGNVDVRTSLGLARIMDSKNPKFRTQARLNLRRRKPDEYPGKECSEYLDMTLNLYGPKSSAVRIGKFLSQKQLYLRAPFSVDTGIEVVNPHAPNVAPRTSLPGLSAGLTTSAGYVSRTVEEIRSDVIGMFDSLEKSENLPEMEADPRITTTLLSHQKQGLYFMTSKEKERVFSEEEEGNNSLWRLKLRPNGQRMYFNVITGHEELTQPPEVLGGILADMMGLGKTLSILSLVVGSLTEAEEWARQTPSQNMTTDVPLVRNSKTTLLVSPMSTMTNWEEQINTHIAPDSLSYYIYHGGNRNQNINHLSQFDIIITTYSTVSSEIYGRGKKKDASPLAQINFFRIVLDEAHMIREQSTRQSQAICTLSAQRRWAVTGTPVQNRLDDLGALIKFLRVKPFNEKHGFAQFILSPFKQADPEILPKLRLLVDSITLRRLKDRIDLPPRHDQLVRLSFSEEEFTLYEWFAKDSDNKMKIIASENKKSLGGKTYVHILRAIMRLRLICAHGRELLNEDDLKITEGFSMNNAIDLEDEEEKPVLSSRQAYEMFMLFKETNGDTCAQCARKIGLKDNESENVSNSNDIIGYMLPCYQIVCKDCFQDVKKSLEQKSISDSQQRFTCPYCEQYMRASFFELTQQGIDVAEEERQEARENPRKAKIMGRYGGPHTKTKALIEALKQSQVESQGLDRPIKSVVFSGWTSHLDLIQIALEDNGFKFARLDGKMTRNKRTAALDAFRDDEETTVFLISIGAGGLGLNLTTGSKIYIMEPQFNPAAEAQAVDRIHRLGQTREVTTTRFIMENSFEEKMLDLQRKKQNLADLSMNRGKLDKAEAAKQRLEELRSLFK